MVISKLGLLYQESWPERERANQVALLAYLGSSPEVESLLSPSLTWVLTGVDSNDYNGVAWARLSADTADQTIIKLLEQFSKRQLPFLWHLNATSQPADLAQRLINQGCTRLNPGVAMALNLSDFEWSTTKFSGLIVQRVTTQGLLYSWLRVWQEVYQESINERERLYSSLGLVGDKPLQHYIASLNGLPLAVAQFFFHQQTAGLYAVGVLPQLQQQGIATAMLSALLQEAARLGYSVAVVGPTPESQRMYEKLGFTCFPSALMAYHIWPDEEVK